MNFLFKMEPPDAGSELLDKYFDLRSKGKFPQANHSRIQEKASFHIF